MYEKRNEVGHDSNNSNLITISNSNNRTKLLFLIVTIKNLVTISNSNSNYQLRTKQLLFLIVTYINDSNNEPG